MINSLQSFHSLFRTTLLFSAAFVLAACAPEAEPGDPAPELQTEVPLAPLTVSGSYWIELSPVLAAAHHFYPQELAVGEGGVTRITAGVADLATNAETQLLRESATNPELRIIMTVTESFYRLVGRRSAGIETLEDLRGKRVMAPMGTSAGYYLQSMLRSVGMTQDDVVLVPFPGGVGDAKEGMDRMADALVNGEVDAISIWEPTPEDALHRLGEDGIMLQDRSVYREVFNLHARAPDLADPEKRRAIVAFVRAVAKASEALKTDPESYYSLITQYTTYSPEQISASLQEMDFSVHIVPDMLDVLETEELWVAAAAKRAPRSREELAQFIDYSILEEALAEQ